MAWETRHRHTREDEYSYILEGRVGALLGDEVLVGGPGDLIFKPRNQWHTFWNAGDEPARVLEIISPAGFERFFAELAGIGGVTGATPEALADLCDRYGQQVDPGSIPGLIDRFGGAHPRRAGLTGAGSGWPAASSPESMTGCCAPAPPGSPARPPELTRLRRAASACEAAINQPTRQSAIAASQRARPCRANSSAASPAMSGQYSQPRGGRWIPGRSSTPNAWRSAMTWRVSSPGSGMCSRCARRGRSATSCAWRAGHHGGFVAGMLKNGMNFDRYIGRQALAAGTAPPQVLLAGLKDTIGKRSVPPMTTPVTMLSDIVCHSVDMRRPLGISRTLPEETLIEVANSVKTTGFPFGPGNASPGFVWSPPTPRGPLATARKSAGRWSRSSWPWPGGQRPSRTSPGRHDDPQGPELTASSRPQPHGP